MFGAILPLGGGTPGKSNYQAAFEESKARAEERQLDRSREGLSDPNRRTQAIGRLLMSGVAVLLMTYAAWEAFGPVVGVVAGIALVVGAVVLWRFWR